ncbi:hypothetical protein ABQX22_21045, partial [Xanthomonas sp. WHRI 1810A]|uniref:hypothetical protein n=1 Tax=Xanthomonas sp. WHRI 1810A TaxID=3161565 RepID=UPI0032E85F44
TASGQNQKPTVRFGQNQTPPRTASACIKRPAHTELLLPKAWELACLRSGAKRQQTMQTRYV